MPAFLKVRHPAQGRLPLGGSGSRWEFVLFDHGTREVGALPTVFVEQGRREGESKALVRGRAVAHLDLWAERVLSAPTLTDALGA
jgi:hypothetical protein